MSELEKKLAHRNAVNDGDASVVMKSAPKNIYTDFPEFTRKQIKEYEGMFKKYVLLYTIILDLLLLLLLLLLFFIIFVKMLV